MDKKRCIIEGKFCFSKIGVELLGYLLDFATSVFNNIYLTRTVTEFGSKFLFFKLQFTGARSFLTLLDSLIRAWDLIQFFFSTLNINIVIVYVTCLS